MRLEGILNEVWNHKLVFVETPDANETSIALENYRRVGEILVFLIYESIAFFFRLVIMVEAPYCYL